MTTEPINEAESAEAAARRFAGELQRLYDGLIAAGVRTDPHAPVDTAAVDAALALAGNGELVGRLRAKVTDLTAELATISKAHVCTDRCRPNAHVAFMGRRRVQDLTAERDQLRDHLRRAEIRARSSLLAADHRAALLTRILDAAKNPAATLKVTRELVDALHAADAAARRDIDSYVPAADLAWYNNHTAKTLDERPPSAAAFEASGADPSWVRPPAPEPSQGQDIPTDQIDAIVGQAEEVEGGRGQIAFPGTLARLAYRIGFAAALGYEITVSEDGGGVVIGDRPGGQCPQCGAYYPRTIPAGQDQRCWTCSLDDSMPTVDVWAELRRRLQPVTALIDAVDARSATEPQP